MKSPIAWGTIQKAIYSWFFDATEIQTAWADQKRPQDDLADAFGTLRVLSLVPEADAETRTREEDSTIYEDSFSTHLLTLNCQVASASADFDSHAAHILSKAQAALRVPSIANDLTEAGVSVVSLGTISNISAIAGAGFVSRASVDVVFRIASLAEADTATGYFDKVQVNGGEDLVAPEE